MIFAFVAWWLVACADVNSFRTSSLCHFLLHAITRCRRGYQRSVSVAMTLRLSLRATNLATASRCLERDREQKHTSRVDLPFLAEPCRPRQVRYHQRKKPNLLNTKKEGKEHCRTLLDLRKSPVLSCGHWSIDENGRETEIGLL